MGTPFDRRILWVHWKGDAVAETSITQMAQAIKRDTPNVAGVAVKTSNGAVWQGDLGDKAAMAVKGTDGIKRWVDDLGAQGLETHLWCVVTGSNIPVEAQLIVQACNVAGVKSMLLDVEGGAAYFGGRQAEDARNLITRVRAGIPSDFHLGLNLDARGSHPASIHIQEWIPYVQSLHPMVYHWEFGGGRNGPDAYLDDAFGVLVRYGLPIVPMLQTYPNPTNPVNPIPEEEVYKAGEYSFNKGAVGITLFRYGRESSAAAALAGTRRIDPKKQRTLVQPTTRIFRTTASSLRVRSQPTTQNTAVLTVLATGTKVEANAQSRTESDSYVWWKIEQGWAAQERIDKTQSLMVEVTPGVPPYGLVTLSAAPDNGGDGPSDPVIQQKRFRVVTNSLNVRIQPELQSQYLLPTSLIRGDIITVDADAWVEKNGYVWWNHGPGWSAEYAVGSGVRLMEDLTPEIPRKDPLPTDNPDGTPTPDPTPTPTPEPTVPNKLFRVTAASLNVRATPGISQSTVGSLKANAEITVKADAWRELDNYVWWQHGQGWSAERTIDGRTVFMQDLTPNVPRVEPDKPTTPDPTPTPTPTPTDRFEPIPAGIIRFQVVALGVRVRSAPDTSAPQVGNLIQGTWLNIDTKAAGVRAEADGYVWWRHDTGWSAERTIDGKSVFMLDVGSLPMLGTLLQRLPVRIEDTDWIQYYGNTGFAYRNGRANSYHTFAQGLHSGLDFGKFTSRRDDPSVFAAVNGLFDGKGSKYGPNRVDVRVGNYRIIYGHIGKPASLPRNQPVTPDSVMGTVEFSQIHLHFEIRYKDTYIINPLLMMPQNLVDQFIRKFPPSATEFVKTGNWNRWLTPFDQPIIRLGGEVVGPTA